MGGIVPVEIITSKILLIHGEKVMLDSDLAELYGVETPQLLSKTNRSLSGNTSRSLSGAEMTNNETTDKSR